jgi:hypothetical protein
MTSDQFLQEAIIDLQKQDLTSESRHVVEEAARLLLDGRDIEARALFEKAQAMAIPRNPTAGGATDSDQRAPVNGRIAPTILSRLSGRLAAQIEDTLNETVEELFGDLSVEVSQAAARVESQLADIQSRLQIVSHLQSRLDRFEQEMSLSSAAASKESQRFVASLEELNQAHRCRLEELSDHVSDRMEQFVARLAVQEERVDALSGLTENVSAKVLAIEAQVDRQTSCLRGMQERQAKRAAALSAVVEGISKLRDAETLVSTAEAG